MGRLARAFAAALAVSAGLSGCAAETAREPAASAEIRVSGAFAGRPQVSFPKGWHRPVFTHAGLHAGEGPAIGPHDLVVAHYTAFVWSGRQHRLADSSFENGVPATFAVDGVIPGLTRSLAGRRVGGRVLATIPPKFGYGDRPPRGLRAEDTLVYVIDILGTHPPDRRPLKPGVHKGRPAARLTAKVLDRGAGPVTRPGQLVVVRYEGRIWGSGRIFDATWQRGGQPTAFRLGAGDVITAWDRRLAGVPVGSRIQLAVPPADGYGTRGLPPKVKGTDTLEFVVDIIAAY